MKPRSELLQAEAILLEAESLLDRRQLSRAASHFDLAEALGADQDRCSAGRWMVCMLCGDFAAAWQESDAIRRRGGPDPHRFWNGESIEGQPVMLRCLHGFGDAVQMLRYVPALRSRCSNVTVEVAPRLFELAPHFEGVDQVITWRPLAPADPPVWTVQTEIMELPYLFRTEQWQLPMATNYLKLPTTLQEHTRKAMQPRRAPRVGLVWAAGEWNPARSVPFTYIQQLAQTPGCEFWSLQGGTDARKWNELSSKNPTYDATCAGEGIAALAAVIEQLDLVITVDTLAAHLAGALGTPAWVVLQFAADWRWMVEGADSPWYPSLRLYRQTTEGDWSGVFDRVTGDLARWLAHAGRLELAG